MKQIIHFFTIFIAATSFTIRASDSAAAPGACSGAGGEDTAIAAASRLPVSESHPDFIGPRRCFTPASSHNPHPSTSDDTADTEHFSDATRADKTHATDPTRDEMHLAVILRNFTGTPANAPNQSIFQREIHRLMTDADLTKIARISRLPEGMLRQMRQIRDTLGARASGSEREFFFPGSTGRPDPHAPTNEKETRFVEAYERISAYDLARFFKSPLPTSAPSIQDMRTFTTMVQSFERARLLQLTRGIMSETELNQLLLMASAFKRTG